MTRIALCFMLFTPYFIHAQSLNLPASSDVVHVINCSPDGRHIIANATYPVLGVYDMMTGKLIHTLQHDQSVRKGLYDPSGKYILTSSYKFAGIKAVPGDACLWDAESGQLLHKYTDHSDFIVSLDFNQQSDKILTGSKDSTAKVWDIASGALLHSLEKHTGSVECAKFSPDGKIIVTASSDSSANIWDSMSGNLLHSIEDHAGKVAYAEFSPSGDTLFTASSDNTVKVWSVETGDLFTTLRKHPGNVNFIKFSPDHKYLLTLSTDLAMINNAIQVWDAETLELIHKIEGNIMDEDAPGHRRFISSAVFSNDSKKIYTSSFDQTLKTWDVKTGELIKNLNYYVPYLSFHPTENILLGGSRVGFFLFDGETDNEIIQLSTVNQSPENWMHVHKGKYIDTQEEVLPRIVVLDGGQAYPFSDYKDELFIPDLWSKVLKGEL